MRPCSSWRVWAGASPRCLARRRTSGWAQAAGRFHVLQARPITSLFPLPETLPTDGLHVLISFGVVQGMLDPITPLGRDVFCSALPRALAPLGGPVASARRPIVAGERIFFDI